MSYPELEFKLKPAQSNYILKFSVCKITIDNSVNFNMGIEKYFKKSIVQFLFFRNYT